MPIIHPLNTSAERWYSSNPPTDDLTSFTFHSHCFFNSNHLLRSRKYSVYGGTPLTPLDGKGGRSIDRALDCYSIPCITFPTIFPPVSSSSLFLSRPYLFCPNTNYYSIDPPSTIHLHPIQFYSSLLPLPTGLAWLVSLSLSSPGLHDSPMSSLAHPTCGLISLGLAPLWRPFVERRVYWRSRSRSREKKRKSPRTLSIRRAEGPLPDSPPQL